MAELLKRMVLEAESDSEDDHLPIRRPRYLNKGRSQHFEKYNEKDFEIRFHISKAATLH